MNWKIEKRDFIQIYSVFKKHAEVASEILVYLDIHLFKEEVDTKIFNVEVNYPVVLEHCN